MDGADNALRSGPGLRGGHKHAVPCGWRRAAGLQPDLPSLPYLSYMLWDVGLINTTDKGLMDRLRNESSIAFFGASYLSKERENFQSGADYYALVDKTIVYQGKLTDAQKAIRTTTAVYIWAAAPPPISPGWNVSVVAELGKSLLPPRWAAVFCRPVYYSQNVTASVLMPAGRWSTSPATGSGRSSRPTMTRPSSATFS